ncbi:hypothetical protein COT30_01190 [Candidatus Micrarchaeota archaeon CG08_land_8_20_14_0_20_49_17]|nr:MAG: hypothetical protein AUJ13_06045 [Candidatus Micrarchaeota archaeon CG1_02_49_24]PIU10060.1 MAG: hypothetical protein COT30_01190 [Candidatus Micrarchaeota archaeon CG08_land_8_20_14_0_20_49_17]PIU82650.1 MAG: hypothetical protein COS70_00190 [Candidatus Micrarchaeota archaeon CG06_land_8_20_14_3_00_50_6]PIZ94464.1 MAG: hypothetical protein COX84_05200 [Candidatus Micrarchaeota archaeon CG_4_10_14_0_2_um_filter_49_7]HII54010.1 hypothetical protein [Candidatus Micrarchaeota archaeon]
MKFDLKNVPKYVASVLFCLLLRAIPGRPPNIEPVMASLLPLSKANGKWVAAIYAAAIMVLFDLLTKFGDWTYITAATYALVGIVAAYWFKDREPSPAEFALFSIPATIAYDVITAILSMLPYGMSIEQILIGQIPFTINHLLGNVALCFIVSPLLYHYVFMNEKLDLSYLKAKAANLLK